MPISSIIVNKPVGNFMNYTAKNWFAKGLEKGLKEPATYAAKIMVLSIVSKDLVGCVFYTYQSYNNKKIPEEKRKFVAALDAMNGIIMVGGQLAASLCVEKTLTPWIESFYTGCVKDRAGKEECVKPRAAMANGNIFKLTEEVIKNKKAELMASGANMNEIKGKTKEIADILIKELGQGSSKSKDIAKGVGIIISSLATMAFIKRTMAPFLATPLAGWAKEKFMNKQKPDAPHGRVYYEWKNLSTDKKIDQSAFGKFVNRT